jgi:hypothetical protein
MSKKHLPAECLALKAALFPATEGEIAAVRAHANFLETELAMTRGRRAWWRRLTAQLAHAG